MRKAILAVFVLASLLMITCSKSSSGSKKTLYGKWKLVQWATWSPTYEFRDWLGEPAYITFHRDGTFTSSPMILDNNQYNRFTILNDSMLAVPRVMGQGNVSVPARIEGDTLTMYVPCIEPCGLKLTKVN